MSKSKRSGIAEVFGVTSLLLILAACSSSSDNDGTSFTPPPSDGGSGGTAPDAPQDVWVVSGDDASNEVWNSISWTLVTDATDYTVYWDNAAGVTENSSVVVPAVAGNRHVVHSDMDVVAGSAYYYRVQADSADGASALSDEVSGVPQQSISGNQLNDVAWNGVDTLVAVGDSGVIMSSPNGTTDGWLDVSDNNVPQTLTGVTWESVNSQFLIVGAGSTVLTGDGTAWTQQDLSNLPGARNLEDAAWVGDRYIAVGNNATIMTSNADGSAWVLQDPGVDPGGTSLSAVATSGNRIVVVGTNGTILDSVDGVRWAEQAKPGNNDLNSITWDGSQFVIAGSNDTVLTSPDGLTWTSHVPGTSDINFVAVTQWDSGLPASPVLAIAGSSGTVVVNPDADPGHIVRTGTNRQLRGMTLVDDGQAPAYFAIVGNDGTVLTAQVE